jgi:very-short-patch-repair endonuclease
MKLLDIIFEEEDLSEQPAGKTKEEFLKDMKEKFPYRGGCRYTFPNQESFPKRSMINLHCKKHNVDFPTIVENLTKGIIGKNGCSQCKLEFSNDNKSSIKNGFYDSAKEIWKDKNGNPLYNYDRQGLRRYSGINKEFDFYCPKIGVDGKPHGKQTVYAKHHVQPDNRRPHYQYQGCKKCKEEQGLRKERVVPNLSRQDFIKKVKEKMKFYKIPINWYDWKELEYVNEIKSAKIKCLHHNEEVLRSRANQFYLQVPLCSQCKQIAIYEKNFIVNLDKYYKGRFVLLSDYIDIYSPVTLGCTLHGKTPFPMVYKRPSMIWSITKKHGSIKCDECDRLKRLKILKKDFKNIHGKKFINGKKLQYTYPNIDKEFVNQHIKIPIICHKKSYNGREHGMFLQEPVVHKEGSGCPICQESRNEIYIANLLNQKRIKFEKQYKFSKTGNLEFDFYVPKYKVLIEYDGIQHFKPIFGSSDYSRQLNYNNTYNNDNLKNQFVETNNLGLRMIRIPHTLQGGQYDELLLIELKKVIGKRKIKHIGDYPERETPKQAAHPKKINESKLSLMGVLGQIL